MKFGGKAFNQQGRGTGGRGRGGGRGRVQQTTGWTKPSSNHTLPLSSQYWKEKQFPPHSAAGINKFAPLNNEWYGIKEENADEANPPQNTTTAGNEHDASNINETEPNVRFGTRMQQSDATNMTETNNSATGTEQHTLVPPSPTPSSGARQFQSNAKQLGTPAHDNRYNQSMLPQYVLNSSTAKKPPSPGP